MSAPRISVVLAAYQASWCVERALDSVFRQTRLPDQVLLCDDGSTDGTPDLVERRYGARVTVLRLPHRNASAARAEGMRAADGDWLAFLDTDDEWLPEKLERQIETLARHPGIRFLGSDGFYVSEQEVLRESWLSDYFRPVRDLEGDLLPALVERCFPLVSSMLVERAAYHEVGGLDPAMVYSHDYDLWLRLSARHSGLITSDRLVRYHSSPNQFSKRYEGRYRDNLELLRRVAAGVYRADAGIRARGAARAAALAFDLGLQCLRSGRAAEGRALMRAATAAGPLPRRAMAAGGALLPGWVLPVLKKAGWLKGAVSAAREPAAHVDHAGAAEGAS